MNESINILIVDDSQENLKLVSSILKDKGYKIALALDGISALKVLEENSIDLILLDIMMPNMDGLETCKIIKQNEKLKDIPVIFLTAMTDIDNTVKGFQVGGVDYITKPFRKEELYARVKNHLQLKIARDILKIYAIQNKDAKDSFILKLMELEKKIDQK